MIPAEPGSVDVLYAYSVFSHMLDHDVAGYGATIASILAPGGPRDDDGVRRGGRARLRREPHRLPQAGVEGRAALRALRPPVLRARRCGRPGSPSTSSSTAARPTASRCTCCDGAEPGRERAVDYLFVVTYGRSGSTLVGGLLNAIPGYLIRGENDDALRHLWQYHRTLVAAKEKRTGTRSRTHPFYGIGDVPVPKLRRGHPPARARHRAAAQGRHPRRRVQGDPLVARGRRRVRRLAARGVPRRAVRRQHPRPRRRARRAPGGARATPSRTPPTWPRSRSGCSRSPRRWATRRTAPTTTSSPPTRPCCAGCTTGSVSPGTRTPCARCSTSGTRSTVVEVPRPGEALSRSRVTATR